MNKDDCRIRKKAGFVIALFTLVLNSDLCIHLCEFRFELKKETSFMLLPEFLQSPVVCGSIFLILHFNSDNSLRERPPFSLVSHAGGQQVRRQRRIKSVRQEDKLELHLRTTQGRKSCQHINI